MNSVQILNDWRRNGYNFPIELMSQGQAGGYRRLLEAVEVFIGPDICSVVCTMTPETITFDA